MAEATPKKRHVTIFGQMNAAGSIGFIVGPPIGGHMAELPGGFYIISMLSAGLFVLNFGRLIHALFSLSIKLKLCWRIMPKISFVRISEEICVFCNVQTPHQHFRKLASHLFNAAA